MRQGCVLATAQSDVFKVVSVRIMAVAMCRLPFLATEEGQYIEGHTLQASTQDRKRE